jgi:sec-independent protein translocase protein TatC
MNDEEKIPFTSHLEELRKRLITCFIAVFIGFVLCYSIKEWLFKILTSPLISIMQPGEKLIFTSLPEAFFVYLKVAFLSGTILAIPIILYQFWMFIAPGLYTEERRHLAPIMVLSVFFFIGGAFFGYYVVFPIGFEFFLSFASDSVRPLLTMREFLSFASLFLLVFGLIFELPLVLVFLVKLGIISIDFLTKNRKYAILLIFIVAAILTPPDVISQTLMAIPMMALYEIGILGARIFVRKKPLEDVPEDTPPERAPEESS